MYACHPLVTAIVSPCLISEPMKKWYLPIVLLSPLLARAGEPLDLARRVADKVVDSTRFELEYRLQKADGDFGCVDFGRSMDRPGVAYALTTLRCEGDTEEWFELGCTGPVRISIDDSVVYERCEARPFAVDLDEKNYRLPERFRCRLTAGPHKLLVKTEYRGGEHLFLLQSRNFSRYAERGCRISCTLDTYAPGIRDARWLLLGTFAGRLTDPLPPDSLLLFHRPYVDGERLLAWNIPPLNIVSAPVRSGRFYDWNYHVGCFAWALQRLSAATGDDKYAAYADAWCDFWLETAPLAEYQSRRLHAVRSFGYGASGRPMLDYRSAPAMPYITRCVESSDAPPSYRQQALEVLDYLRSDQFRVAGVFARNYTSEPSVWADDMFMGLPYLVYGYRLTGDSQLLEDAVAQLKAFNRLLFDPDAGLYRQACYPSQPDVRVPHWSRGNGWALWATCEILDELPHGSADYCTVLALYRRHIDGLLRWQDSDGFWRNILDRAGSDRESSGAAIFTYCMARGINRGWLPRSRYLEPLERAWSALTTFVTEEGDFTGVKGGTNFSTDPEDYERVKFIASDTHGLLPFLFAAMEMERLQAVR